VHCVLCACAIIWLELLVVRTVRMTVRCGALCVHQAAGVATGSHPQPEICKRYA
jgi:hypothetical protein